MRNQNKKGSIGCFFRQYGVSYFMLSFWLIIFFVFTVLPILSSVVLSFTDFDMLRVPNFVGLNNYLRLLLNDNVFLIALKNTLVFAIITGPVGYLMSFVLAWFINDTGKYVSTFLTMLFYAPSLVGNVYFIWMYLFSGDSYGMINSWLIRLNIIIEPIQWLTDARYNIYVVILVILWMSMGTGFLAFVAGFKQLNNSLFEAGALDGVRNRWQELYYIVLPQMAPQLMIGAVLAIAGSFAVGYQCMMLTGFPSTDYSTHTIVLHILDHGYYRYEMGYASCISVVLFVLMLVTWAIISKGIRKFSDED
ncbi:MAG: sugar ABC transporter permease [Clostridiales bacterium]|nr:sugar ABC transporter permease [Clostridiales bacterium]